MYMCSVCTEGVYFVTNYLSLSVILSNNNSEYHLMELFRGSFTRTDVLEGHLVQVGYIFSHLGHVLHLQNHTKPSPLKISHNAALISCKIKLFACK